MQADKTKVPQNILVLGIGNVLWADEGFGVRCVETMAQTYSVPANVRLMDGGTQGLYLLPFLEECDALIVFDAVDFGLEPGMMVTLRDKDVPAFMGAKKMSLHQTGFQDVLATAELMGYAPAYLTLIGCQPEEIEDYGGGLRQVVSDQIQPAIAECIRELQRWDVAVVPGRTDSEDLADVSIQRGAYENGRPDEDEACRIGDHRFFPSAAKVRA
ncbi:HyaD/HybD family hydrogenase maturation endopeptidase [Thioclava sp. GXIMD4216]|uniref:HyaD/HybD family hydrogenase maturation endopeptidase n=1 Tax=Thioclava sp. GXIMD4216 TaxID=3131929 RepID=UPI0030CBC2DE